MGKTFCLLKPEVSDRIDEIERDIVKNNYSIVKRRELYWDYPLRIKYLKENLSYHSEQANIVMRRLVADYYKKYKLWVVALILSSEGDTIRDFVDFCGPRDAMEYVKAKFKNRLRGKHGLGPEHSFVRTIEGRECRYDFNGIHRSSREEEFKKEPPLYFPEPSL